MSTNSNIVRDRTLVLRVLVPGLHSSLNDKINSIQDGESKSSSTPTAGGTIKADKLLNLEGVTCLPSSHGSTLWHFRCDGATYPARLVNLPCPVEVHKTVDHATYHKASDVGQMLIVYEDEYAMEEAENAPGYKVEGFPSYYHSGLTPPMKRVVRRRFLSRFKERDVKPVPPRRIDVQNVEEEIKKLIEKLSDKGKVGKGRKGAAPPPKDRIITEIEEEIVDYEPWMGDGGTFTLEDAKSHPEWWLSKSEIKEIEDAKAKELRKEREAAEALQAEMEAQRLAEEAAAEKKAKKQKKKKEKKKKQQEEDMAMQETQYAQSAVVAAAEEMDEVTAAAMMINQEIDNEELLLDDDMFDFANEDISDLL